MRHYIVVVMALLLLFLAVFAIVESTGIPLLTDPTQQLTEAGPFLAAAIGVGLLIVDVLLPVPSSVVMVLHGAFFGALLGMLLSLVGSLGAALVGFAIGRRGGPLLNRLVPPAERRRADELLGRWGSLAVVVSRPVPLLAETVAILAGAARSVSWLRFTVAAVIGSLPAAALYGVAGALAVDFAGLSLVFVVVLALAVLTWLVERGVTARASKAVAAHGSDAATGVS